MNNILKKFHLGVAKPVLVSLSGLVWLGTGIMLLSMAAGWLKNTDEHVIWYTLAGVIAGIVAGFFGFSRIVDKNLSRIRKIDGLYCAFGFMPWKSYLIIVVMMTLGLVLKSSALPKEYLSIIYICIGLALSISSIRYFASIKKLSP